MCITFYSSSFYLKNFFKNLSSLTCVFRSADTFSSLCIHASRSRTEYCDIESPSGERHLAPIVNSSPIVLSCDIAHSCAIFVQCETYRFAHACLYRSPCWLFIHSLRSHRPRSEQNIGDVVERRLLMIFPKGPL